MLCVHLQLQLFTSCLFLTGAFAAMVGMVTSTKWGEPTGMLLSLLDQHAAGAALRLPGVIAARSFPAASPRS